MLPKEYIEKVAKTIKKTNMRITRIAKQFGTDSEVYKSQIKSIKSTIDSKYVYENARGELQISTTLAKSFTDATAARKAGYAMGKVKTVKQTREFYAEKLGISSEDVDLSDEEMQKLFDEKAEELDEIYSDFTKAMSKFYKESMETETEIKTEIDSIMKKLKDRGGQKRRLTVEEVEDITKDIEEAHKKFKKIEERRLEEARKIRDAERQPWEAF